jgi:hypothetical protein
MISANPRRRRFQFSLRTIFVVMTIAVTCVWVGWDVLEVWQRKTMIAWIESQGGRVYRYRTPEEIEADEARITAEIETNAERIDADAAPQSDQNRPLQHDVPGDKGDAAPAEDSSAAPDDLTNQEPFVTNLTIHIGGGQEIHSAPPEPAPNRTPLRRLLGDTPVIHIFVGPSTTPPQMARIKSLFPEAHLVGPPRGGPGGGGMF